MPDPILISAQAARVAAPATVELEGYRFPVNGQAISLPHGEQLLNALYLRAGRLPEPGFALHSSPFPTALCR